MGDHGLHRLALGQQRAWLYQPRHRQARPESDRFGEGDRELRIRSCRPLSDHRTDHGARTRVLSSRDLRDRSGGLRHRVNRPSRSMARHERGENGEERAVASSATGGGRVGARSCLAGRRKSVRRPGGGCPAARSRPLRGGSRASRPGIRVLRRSCGSDSFAGVDGRAQALFHLWRRPEPGGSLVLQSGPLGAPSVHRPGKRGRRAERHGGGHRCRELRPGRMVGHLQTAPSRSVGRRVLARTVHAGRLLGLGWVLARAWQQAGSHGLVLPLRRARRGSIGRRPDDSDGGHHPPHRAGGDRSGYAAGTVASEELGGERGQQPATSV